jgi:hypothetical protein
MASREDQVCVAVIDAPDPYNHLILRRTKFPMSEECYCYNVRIQGPRARRTEWILLIIPRADAGLLMVSERIILPSGVM